MASIFCSGFFFRVWSLAVFLSEELKDLAKKLKS